MKKLFNLGHFLTDRVLAALFSFTLFVTAACVPHPCFAIDNGSNPDDTIANSNSSNIISKDEKDEKDRRVSLVMSYLRHQAPMLVPVLPDAVREPARIAMQGWSSVHESLFGGLDTSSITPDGAAFAHFLEPISSLMRPPSDDEDSAIWMTPGYSHKGFLPNHDAMILGFNTRHRGMGNSVQFDTHPFLGQNWHNSENYWGVETTLALLQPSTKPNGKPWGKISLRYTNGDDAVMNQSRGFDMHTELRFDNHLSLHAGVREETGSGVGNYVVLRWQLAELGD